MIDQTVLITYSLIVLGFVFIPGPATLLTVARATTSGTKVGIATGAGITAGDIIHTVMAVAGISAIIAASATLFSIVKYLGAAYLVYLGFKAILDKAPVDLGQGRLPITAPQAFRQAILAEVLNPKQHSSSWHSYLSSSGQRTVTWLYNSPFSVCCSQQSGFSAQSCTRSQPGASAASCVATRLF